MVYLKAVGYDSLGTVLSYVRILIFDQKHTYKKIKKRRLSDDCPITFQQLFDVYCMFAWWPLTVSFLPEEVILFLFFQKMQM